MNTKMEECPGEGGHMSKRWMRPNIQNPPQLFFFVGRSLQFGQHPHLTLIFCDLLQKTGQILLTSFSHLRWPTSPHIVEVICISSWILKDWKDVQNCSEHRRNRSQSSSWSTNQCDQWEHLHQEWTALFSVGGSVDCWWSTWWRVCMHAHHTVKEPVNIIRVPFFI